MNGATLGGGQGPSYSAPMPKSLRICIPYGLPATPAFCGSPAELPAMLYIAQWVKAAVTSYSVTTRLRVPGGAPVHESWGDSFPPGAPLIEQAFAPFTMML